MNWKDYGFGQKIKNLYQTSFIKEVKERFFPYKPFKVKIPVTLYKDTGEGILIIGGTLEIWDFSKETFLKYKPLMVNTEGLHYKISEVPKTCNEEGVKYVHWGLA